MSVVLFCAFGVAALVFTAAAVTGRRGQVCQRGMGYAVPARVEADPELSEKANEMVASWSTVGAFLALAPMLVLTALGLGRDEPLPLWVLVVFAAYGFLLVCLGSYPFEKIEQLGDSPQPHADGSRVA